MNTCYLNRLNGSGGANWNAHKIEQTLWAHSVLCETAKELLDAMPWGKPATNGVPGASDGEECSRDSLDSTANKENLTSNGVSDQDSNTGAILKYFKTCAYWKKIPCIVFSLVYYTKFKFVLK